MITATSVGELRGMEDVAVMAWLEEVTGADLIVSPLDVPIAPALLSTHIEAGAVLVQVKIGHDLAASVMDGRLTKSLAKMRSIEGIRQSQCVLLFVGWLNSTDEGEVLINGKPSYLKGESFWRIQTALSHWNARGGVVEILPKNSLYPRWLKETEARLKSYLASPVVIRYPDNKLLLPDTEDVLQDLVEVRDWRRTINSIPGIGSKKIEALLAYMERTGAEMSLARAIWILTTWTECQQIPGFGIGIWRSVRQWFGLPDDHLFEYGVYVAPKGET